MTALIVGLVLLDAHDRGVDELGGAALARGDELGLRGCVERGEVGGNGHIGSGDGDGDDQAWTGGCRSAHGAAASSCAATRMSRSSRPNPPTSWTPTGRPSALQWRGTLIAG